MASSLSLISLNDKFRVSKLESLRYVQQLGLVSTSYICPTCGKAMRLTAKRQSVRDGFHWLCRNRSEEQSHLVNRSVRKGSWFEKSNLPFSKIMLITYMWLKKCTQKQVSDELKIGSAHTVVDWFSFCREVVEEVLLLNSSEIGGRDVVVEVDEAKFGKWKFHDVAGDWAFVGVEKGKNKLFICPTEERSPEALLSCIKEYVLPGTTVYSKCWQTYSCEEDEDFQQMTVDHNITFKDPATELHSDTSEGMLWALARRSLPPTKREKAMLLGYLCEFIYRRQLSLVDDPFEHFLADVVRIYPPSTQD